MEYSQIPLKALAYELLDMYNAGRTTRDSTISLDIVKELIITKLNKYIRQQVAKGYPISESLIIQFPCIDVIPVDSAECCSVDIGCKFLRTKNPIPQVMDFETSDGFVAVRPLNPELKHFQRITRNRVPFEKKAPAFTKQFIKWYTKDSRNYVYFFYDPTYCPEGAYLEKISIELIPEDYHTALKQTDCSGNLCITDDSPFPMTKILWELIKNDILANEMRIIKTTTEDDSNNNANDNQMRTSK